LIEDGHMKWVWWVVIAGRVLAFAYAVIGVTGFLRLPYVPGSTPIRVVMRRLIPWVAALALTGPSEEQA
jgi:hypothetical protein